MLRKCLEDRHHLPTFGILRQAANASLIVFLLAAMLLAIAPTPVDAQGPEITVAPPSGVPGSMVTITGTGFKRGVLVTIAMDSFVLAGGVDVIANDTFSITGEVPKLPYGEKMVTASVQDRVWASHPFNILAQVEVRPSSGVPGATITTTGAGFPSKSLVTITIDGRVVISDSIFTDGAGTFSAAQAVPQLPSGQKTVVATAGRVSASTLFTVSRPRSRHQSLGSLSARLAVLLARLSPLKALAFHHYLR